MENIRIIPVGLRDWAVVANGRVVEVFKSKKEAQKAALRLAMGVVGGA